MLYLGDTRSPVGELASCPPPCCARRSLHLNRAQIVNEPSDDRIYSLPLIRIVWIDVPIELPTPHWHVARTVSRSLQSPIDHPVNVLGRKLTPGAQRNARQVGHAALDQRSDGPIALRGNAVAACAQTLIQFRPGELRHFSMIILHARTGGHCNSGPDERDVVLHEPL